MMTKTLLPTVGLSNQSSMGGRAFVSWSNMETRICHKCNRTLTSDCFNRTSPTKCKDCRKEYNAAYKAANGERIRSNQRKYREEHREHTRKKSRDFYYSHKLEQDLKCKQYDLEHLEERRDRTLDVLYGITQLDYERIYSMQGGKCAICGKEETARACKSSRPKRLSVDHNHKTGEIRGLLCNRCNTAIGHLQENPVTLINAANYILSHKAEDEKYIMGDYDG